jgi:hypothetical protein
MNLPEAIVISTFYVVMGIVVITFFNNIKIILIKIK